MAGERDAVSVAAETSCKILWLRSITYDVNGISGRAALSSLMSCCFYGTLRRTLWARTRLATSGEWSKHWFPGADSSSRLRSLLLRAKHLVQVCERATPRFSAEVSHRQHESLAVESVSRCEQHGNFTCGQLISWLLVGKAALKST